MHSLLNIAWLIPAIPFIGATFIAILLISFNRTINRLTKPISFFLISCVFISTLISTIMLLNKVSGQSIEKDLILSTINLHISFYLNLFVEKLLTFSGLFLAIIMTSSYYLLDRRQGYVRYIISISAFSGLLFFIIMNGFIPNLFQS